MTIDKVLKILKARKGCIENNSDWCHEECDEDSECPYYVSQSDELEVIEFLIKILTDIKIWN